MRRMMYFVACGALTLPGVLILSAIFPAMSHYAAFLAIAGIFVLAAYFAPTYQAYSRRKRLTPIIFGLNLFFGWTLVAWFLLLMWAITDEAPVVAVSTSAGDI